MVHVLPVSLNREIIEKVNLNSLIGRGSDDPDTIYIVWIVARVVW